MHTIPGVRSWLPRNDARATTLLRTTSILADADARAAATRLAAGLEADHGLTVRILDPHEPAPGDIVLQLDGDAAPETYTISSEGVLTMRGDDRGLLHATTTVLQLLRTAEQTLTIPAATIIDGPRFTDRGQMIDVGRRFLPLAYLRQQIEQMAWFRLSVLHLHLTDWNGFRIRSRIHPELASAEAYSIEELRELDRFARERGITIVPEIDVPGHATAISRAYPELAFQSESMSIPQRDWEGSDQSGWTLDYTLSATRSLVKELIGEVATIFSGPVIHLGTDEVPDARAQEACAELVRTQKEAGYDTVGDVLVDFINDLNGAVRAAGRTMQIWQWWDVETPTSLQPDSDIMVVQWLGGPEARAAQGYTTIGAEEDRLYVSPGLGSRPGAYGCFDVRGIYESYPFAEGENIAGYRLGRWMDRSYHLSLDFIDFLSRRPLAVLAERTWLDGDPSDAGDLLDRYARVGDSPFVTEEGVALLRGGAVGPALGRAAGIVSATSEETVAFDGAAEHAIDGDPATHWHCALDAGLPQALTIELGDLRMLKAVRYLPRQDGVADGRVADYRIEVSDESGSWRVVASGTFPSGRDESRQTIEWSEEYIGFAATPARRIRFVALTEHNSAQRNAAIAGIDLFATPERSFTAGEGETGSEAKTDRRASAN